MSNFKKISLVLLYNIFFYFSPSLSFAYWQIDQSEFISFLCNTVKEYKACNAPSRVGRFNTYSDCENARRNALPNDWHWQRKTRCVGYDDEPSSTYTPPQQPNYQEQEEEKMRQQIILQQQKAQQEKEKYLRELEQKRIQEIQKFRSLSYQMKTSSPPISQSQKEEYKKALNQAYCIAYNSIKAVEMALKGNLEVSKNLLTDIENARRSAGESFDDKFSISCPQNIAFKIPEVRMSIESDSQYINFKNVAQSAQKLIPGIETYYKDFQTIQEKKKEITDKKKNLEERILNLKQEIKDTKSEKKKEESEDLLAKALALKQQAENEYQEALKDEEKLLKEKQDIENKLNELKEQLLVEEKR
jgi:hypothetical protein